MTVTPPPETAARNRTLTAAGYILAYAFIIAFTDMQGRLIGKRCTGR